MPKRPERRNAQRATQSRIFYPRTGSHFAPKCSKTGGQTREPCDHDHAARLRDLAEQRIEIDRIDAALHLLLMERGDIIYRLIEAKARQGGGSAFRPGREADMMRGLVSRHQGLLPLDTVESIWRIIISTFTFVQSNYSVHADISGGDAAMRDCCRFHFGFTVPDVAHHGAALAIEAVARSGGDLGIVRAGARLVLGGAG